MIDWQTEQAVLQDQRQGLSSLQSVLGGPFPEPQDGFVPQGLRGTDCLLLSSHCGKPDPQGNAPSMAPPGPY